MHGHPGVLILCLRQAYLALEFRSRPVPILRQVDKYFQAWIAGGFKLLHSIFLRINTLEFRGVVVRRLLTQQVRTARRWCLQLGDRHAYGSCFGRRWFIARKSSRMSRDYLPATITVHPHVCDAQPAFDLDAFESCFSSQPVACHYCIAESAQL